MKKWLLTTLFTVSFASCGKIENSSSLDDIRYGGFTDAGSSQFLAAKAAINGACLQCHGVWTRYTEQDFINSGLVVRGSPDNSKLYYRNLLVTTGPGPHNMPPSGYPPLSTGDLSLVATWISGL